MLEEEDIRDRLNLLESLEVTVWADKRGRKYYGIDQSDTLVMFSNAAEAADCVKARFQGVVP